MTRDEQEILQTIRDALDGKIPPAIMDCCTCWYLLDQALLERGMTLYDLNEHDPEAIPNVGPDGGSIIEIRALRKPQK